MICNCQKLTLFVHRMQGEDSRGRVQPALASNNGQHHKSLLHKLEQTKAIRAGRIHPVFIVTGLWASKRCAPTTNCPARGELEEAQRGRWRQSTRTLTQLRTQAVSARQPLWLLPLILCINKAPCCTRERMRSSGAKWTDSGWGDCTLLQRRGGRVVLQIHEVH